MFLCRLNECALGFLQIADSHTCPADLNSECSHSGDWEGDFFPGIPKIKYEVCWCDESKNRLSLYTAMNSA